MRTLRSALVLVIVLMSTSCAITPPEPKIESLGAVNTITSSSDIQMSIVKLHGDPERYCAARQSDVADTRSIGGSLGIGAASADESISEGSSQGALALGGRSPAVLIVREMMYRACELSLNLNTDHDQTLEIYKMFIEEMKAISSMQTELGTASLGQAANSTAQPTASAQKPSSSGSTSSSSTSSSDNVVHGVD